MFKLGRFWELNILIHEKKRVFELKCSFPLLTALFVCKCLYLQHLFLAL